MNAAQQLSFEIAPTQFRGQAVALGQFWAECLNFFAPQIVYSKVVDPRMPYILMGVGALLCGIIAFFLPETAGVKLPDTIQESEILFQDNGLFKLKMYRWSSKVTPTAESTEMSKSL